MQQDRNHKLARTEKWRVGSRLVLAVLLLTICGACWAQTASPVSASLYDIDASGTDIKFVLEALARRSGADIVVSPDIAGQVTAHLKQKSIDDILDYLASVQGFKWTKDGSTYVLTAKSEADKTATETKPDPSTEAAPEVLVWECKHVRPADIATMVGKLFPEIRIAEGPNSATPFLDSGQSSMAGGNTGGGSSASSGTRENNTRVVLVGPTEIMKRVKPVLQSLDVPRRQVSIEVAVTELKTTSDKDVGIDWTWNDLALTEKANAAGGIRFGKYTKGPLSFSAAISALVQGENGNLLSRPNISVIDGETADILIGDRIMFPKLSGYNANGLPIYDKEEERVGIELQIAPKIVGDEVVLALYPQVSLVTGYLKTAAGDYPQISTREARTTVSVKNGATLAIGGLMKNSEIIDTSKVPLLGDLPIIGGLFRHTKKTRDKTEIVIFLSPKIMGEL